jgi:hypothetical protein
MGRMWSEEGEYLASLDEQGKSVKKKAAPKISKVQYSAVVAPEGKVANDSGYGYKDDAEGIMCRRGCGQTITGSLADVKKHNLEVHGE